MDVLRSGFDGFYDLAKRRVFRMTKNDPRVAKKLFINSLRGLRACGLDRLVLDNETNHIESPYVISNAAGFLKDAELDPRTVGFMGLDRAVIGTVTGDPWDGNSGRTMWRFPGTKFFVNREGLPGVGVKEVVRRLEGYGSHGVPLTINLMSTPGKTGDKLLEDLRKTSLFVRDIPYVDRLELNISCPNTRNKSGSLDARAENAAMVYDMISVVSKDILSRQELYVKVSPDSSEEEWDDIIRAGEKYGVAGYTTANTTRNHDVKYVTEKLEEGGASGDAVWDASVRTQEYFAKRVGSDVKLIGCGGINSVERMNERLAIGNCDEIQIFTPLIFEGTGLLRKLREG